MKKLIIAALTLAAAGMANAETFTASVDVNKTTNSLAATQPQAFVFPPLLVDDSVKAGDKCTSYNATTSQNALCREHALNSKKDATIQVTGTKYANVQAYYVGSDDVVNGLQLDVHYYANYRDYSRHNFNLGSNGVATFPLRGYVTLKDHAKVVSGTTTLEYTVTLSYI